MPGSSPKTPSFLLFLDEALRQNASQAAELFLKKNEPIKNAQLHAIPTVIQAKRFSGLKLLIETQKSKNTKKENKSFWEFMGDVILTDPGPEFSLRAFLLKQPEVIALLQQETASLEKREQKKIRKANRAILDQMIEDVLQVYFEHFICHYSYLTRQG